MSSSTIYLVRHAESAHNVSKDFSLRDPGLTELGVTQASALQSTFPALSSVAVVLASPLTRTLETTIAGFGHILSSGDTKLVLDPDLQERSDLPCDTGSPPAALKTKFPALNFSGLKDDWYVKEGAYSADDTAVVARAKAVRQRLADIVQGLEKEETDKKDAVVITHGVFMKFLADDPAIDLPKAGWKAFTLGESAEGDAVLVPVE
ncbi:histidine phosphatase superfamily [Podospora didyma]|uniref:Histidine phosphatase superfamily n=1 Tax=Podospora didyma TaxID=330526 RepID=A0AAE0NUK0_9PEZI|nr:histidine phosphatase superfamily [Podospora didyma]